MRSAVKADNLEGHLAAAVRRYDGPSPLTEQIHRHFGFDGSAPPPERPLRMELVIAAAEEEGGAAEAVLDVACAVEILHHSSLVHDDLDGPFGQAHGINAGDALCAIAFMQLLDGAPRRPDDRTVLMTRRLHEASYAMCSGQAGDPTLVAAPRAALLGAACELGALAAGADPERAAAYARLGRSSALAVQSGDLVDALAAGADIDRRGRVRDVFSSLHRGA
jgi:geranylgeranyl pyrophosphate synthase